MLGRPQEGNFQGAKMAYPFLFFSPPYLLALLKVPVPKILKRKVQLSQDWSEVGGKAKERCAEQRPGEGDAWGPGEKVGGEL